jgi:hypothetical protein
MSIPEKRSNRKFGDVMPPEFQGMQANFCRDPACQNFAVSPRRLDPEAANPTDDKLGAYRLVGPVGETQMMCSFCGKETAILSNEGLALELHRLRTANGILSAESCPRESCANHHRPVMQFSDHYYDDGRTPSGARRRGCKACGKRFTLGDHKRWKGGEGSNKDIVKDLVNRGALNAIMRKQEMSPGTLYERIDHIHERMVAFEAFKLRALRSPRWKRKYYALATDAQDCLVNWTSRKRRYPVQLSAISTAESITGFILRTDVNFDPTVGEIVQFFISLLDRYDFDVPEGLGVSHRLMLPTFLRAVADALKSDRVKLPRQRRDELLEKIAELLPKFDPEEAIPADRSVEGAVIKKQYTAIAHFKLIAEMLPADAQFHLITDPDGAFIIGAPTGYAEPLKDQRADLCFMVFEKEMTNPKKRSLVAKYKRRLEKLSQSLGSSEDVRAVRKEYIARYGNRLPRLSHGTPMDWWEVPIATMFEPNKHVGIFYQRSAGLPDEIEDRRLDLLDRTSLHAVDSYFNVMRQRVSYLHRPGKSRATNEHYNAFQPYQPAMLQKIVDICRIYFNWCEARPFRLNRKFDPLDPQPHDPWHDKLDNAYEEQKRRAKREEYTTPAMRMYLATVPVKLETILNTDWHTKLATSRRHKAKPRKQSRMRPQPAGPQDYQPSA